MAYALAPPSSPLKSYKYLHDAVEQVVQLTRQQRNYVDREEKLKN